ncbi:hypothetical protein LguiB_012524 [Lonicera macranthoides]
MNLNEGNSTISQIPEDIIFQILKELPVKTLLKFRVVSKLWCTIIDDPIFVDSHRTRSHTRNGGIRILCQRLEDYRILKIYSTDPEGGSPVPFLTLPTRILCYHSYNCDDHDSDAAAAGLQSVNGLVCRKFCIWNPSTRESIDLPPIRINISSQYDLHESTKERCYVFLRNLLGFDSVSKQYKVINMCDIRFGETMHIEYRILTLGRDLYWRNLDSVPEKLDFRTGMGVCCVDDVIFCAGWIDGTDVIVAFEVGPEKFRVIPFPALALARSMRRHIIQVGGRLGYVSVDYASAGKVDFDELRTATVMESLDYVEARDVDKVTNDEGMTSVDYVDEGNVNYEVMTIWILEDYHQQQWKKEISSFPSILNKRGYDIFRSITTTPMGSIHTSEILFSHQQNRNHGNVDTCSYYDLESNSLRMVPKITAFPKENQQPKDYKEDAIQMRTRFIDFTKHVECLFRLK